MSWKNFKESMQTQIKLHKMSKKGQMGRVIGVGLGAFTMIIMMVMVDQLLDNTTFSSPLAETVKPYIVPLGLITVVAIIALAIGRRR